MRVLICGGGVIGASIAYFLSCRGAEAIVIERTGIACAASGKSGGFLALDWCDGSPLESLARRSFALHASLAETIGADWGYRRLVTYGGFARAQGGGRRGRAVNAVDWVSDDVVVDRRLGATDTRVWNIEGHHFSERCGLFIIIALGESILVTGSSFGQSDWSGPAIAAFASAFLSAIAMWWLYFDVGAERAARQLTEEADPGRMARLAYTYFHIPIVAGIIVTAASDEIALAHPLGHAGTAEIFCLIGGPALYLFGNLIFKRTNARHFPLSHLVGLGLLALIVPFAWRLSPLHLSLAATAVLVLVAIWEMRSLKDTRATLRDDPPGTAEPIAS